MSSSPLVSVLLAGGQSRRMGRDKRFLFKDGKTWLQHAIDLLSRLDPDGGTVLVSGFVEGFEGVPDLQPHQGPLMGLFSVMSHLWSQAPVAKRLLVIPVDMPLLSREVLEGLTKAEVESQVQVVAYTGNELPMVLALNEETMSIAERLLQGEPHRRSFRNLQSQLKVHWLEPIEKKDFINFNSPQDLELL